MAISKVAPNVGNPSDCNAVLSHADRRNNMDLVVRSIVP